MSGKKIALAAAGLLIIAGAVAAVSAQGHRAGNHDGHFAIGDNDGHGMRGRFGKALTKDEFDARVRERFARLDKNTDNIVDRAEMEAAINERMSRRHSHRRHMKGAKRHGDDGHGRFGHMAMHRFDADRDGKVTLVEVETEYARRFAEMDLDSNGRIDDADLPPMMRGRNIIAEGVHTKRRGHRLGGMGGMAWLHRADADRNGVVTSDEVKAMAAREHGRFDRNKDGVVDAADRQALRQEMVDYAVKRFAHRHGAAADAGVTREQFQAKAAERFARMDIDGDGTISRGERRGHGGGGWRHGGGHHPMDSEHGGKGGRGGPGERDEPSPKN
jgi:Ca2+-binding EF-hand superfamily protein